jgi:hypothetical protein
MIIKLVVTVMLVWALAHHSYSYYILLRWVVCGAAVFTVIRAAELDKDSRPPTSPWQSNGARRLILNPDKQTNDLGNRAFVAGCEGRINHRGMNANEEV